MNNKIIFAIIAIIVLAVGAFFSQSFLIGGSKSCYEGENGKIACVKPSESNIPFSIELSNPIPSPGEDVTVTLGLQMPYADTVQNANLQLREGSAVIESWDLKDDYPCTGCSFQLDVSINAPSEPGEYELFFYSYSGDGELLYKESKSFEVGRTECPEDSCNRWNELDSVSNGMRYQRQCYSYGSAPDCEESVEWEYKLECDSGYIVEGTNNNIITGSLGDINEDCVQEQQTEYVDCYFCDNGEIASVKQPEDCSGDSDFVADKSQLNCGTDDGTGDTGGINDGTWDSGTGGTDDGTGGTDDSGETPAKWYEQLTQPPNLYLLIGGVALVLIIIIALLMFTGNSRPKRPVRNYRRR